MKETESNKSSRDADKAKGSGRLAPSSLSMASIHDNEAMETRKTGHFTRGDDMDSVHAAARESSSFNQKRQTNENELELTKLLKFKSLDIETEFLEYFARENLRRWKKTNHLMFFVVSLLYVYLLARNNADSITYEEKYNPSLRVEESICPTGWFCSVCDPSIICTTYQPTYDASLWFVAVLVPYVAGQGVSYYCKPNLFAKYVDKISMAIIIAQQFIGIGIRYHIVDAGQTFLEPTILMNSIISFSFVGLNASFRHALPTLALIFISWVVLTTIAENHALVPHTERSRLLGLVTMFITFSVLSYGSYESERFYRLQFLTSKDMKKNNAKLKNQLNQLAKSYNQKASKNLESPLERSMLLIRSVMADPTLSSRQLMALGQVTTLLGSSNLLTPDIETNMDETMDNDTQAWLFSEIAARRRKGRSKSIQFRRRVSMGPRELPILESITNEMSSSNGLSTDNRVVSFSNCQEQSAISGYSDNRAAYPPEILEIANILERYNDYDFNLFNLSNATGNRSLYILSHHLFAQANLFEAYNIPRDKFSNCIAAIEQGYHADLPYHNSIHATDVLHCIHTLANTSKVKNTWTEVELLSMYFAAIIHDHDHPGVNNNFLIVTGDPKAVLYNDKSVLENHHSASSFLILAKPENNFLAHLTKQEFKSIREIVVDLVLATDLTQHFTLLSMFKSKTANIDTFDPDEVREDRMLLFKIMIKCSDVSNPTKDMSIYKPWVKLIMQEFMMQGDLEKQLGIPVSPYMDRDNVNVPNCQVGFIDFVVQPLFGALDTYQPLPQIISRLAKNREYWGQLKAAGVTIMPEEEGQTGGHNNDNMSLQKIHVVVDVKNDP